MTGLEKFSHLEDKIYRIIESHKTLQQQREQLEQQIAGLRQELDSLNDEKGRLTEQVDQLMSERDEIRVKVESMLDAIAIIDPELAEAVRK